MRATTLLLSAFLCCFCHANVGEHASAWLTMLGDWVQRGKKIDITGLKTQVDGQFVQLINVKEIVPIYCNNMSTIEYTGHRLIRGKVKTACEWFRNTTAKYLIGFGHRDLSRAKFPTEQTRIVYKGQSITYHQVEWTIPWVCSKTTELPFEEAEIDVLKQACVFLLRKVKTFLEELHSLREATCDQFDRATASDERKLKIMEKTKPYVRHVCKRVQTNRINGAVAQEMVEDIVEMGRMLIPDNHHW